jgi:hypothetical protein
MEGITEMDLKQTGCTGWEWARKMIGISVQQELDQSPKVNAVA